MVSLTETLNQHYPLIVADLANNHNGDVDLAAKMIQELFEIQQKYKFTIIPKFQYRDLDTYIHKDYKGNVNNKYISRFESTRLEFKEFLELTNLAKSLGMLTAATPFDEKSAEKVLEHKHSILKVASATANDWNLLENCVKQKLPMIVSLGGLSDYQIERVVTFLKHREADFALMHCVALYPSKDNELNLERIRTLSGRFHVPVGFSTHEHPENYLAGGLALAAGAQILERHYAKSKPGLEVNTYSSEKIIFENWLINLRNSLNQLHDLDFAKNLENQQNTLRQLKRGLYASKSIKRGEGINKSNTYAAFPVLGEQYTSNELTIRSNLILSEDVEKDQAILKSCVNETDIYSTKESILSRTRELLSQAGINLGPRIDVEISHHLGIENFQSVGAILIPLINREYAKKLVVMTKDQSHPEHFHKLKEETFLVHMGKLKVMLENEIKILAPGDVLVIPRKSKHSMFALADTVFEEISSTNFSDDSFYSESQKFIENRKTPISLWF